MGDGWDVADTGGHCACLPMTGWGWSLGVVTPGCAAQATPAHLQLTVLCLQKPGILGDSPLGTLQPGTQPANPLLGELSAGNRPCLSSSFWT